MKYVRLKVLIVVNMKSSVFSDVTPSFGKTLLPRSLDGGTGFHINFGNFLPDYTASHPRRSTLQQ
jgi:hypothetical protein